MCLQASDVLFDDQVVCKSISDTLVVTLKWVLGKNCKNSTVKSSYLRGMMEHGLNFIHSLECCVLEIFVTLVSKDKVDHGGHHLMRVPVHMTFRVGQLKIFSSFLMSLYQYNDNYLKFNSTLIHHE